MGNDELLMPYLDACSIACGGHAGTPYSMQKTVEVALKYNVSIGAHPSFPDKENFGRKIIAIEKELLINSLIDQIESLKIICKSNDVELTHIKLHGALYNLAAIDVEYANLVLQAFHTFKELSIYAPWNSAIDSVAKDLGVNVIKEAFADRRYHSDLSLVSRNKKNAVIHDSIDAVDQVLSIVNFKKVKTIDGNIVPFKGDTFCVHGDNSTALEIVKALKKIQING